MPRVKRDPPPKGVRWESSQVVEATLTATGQVQRKADIAGSNPAFPAAKEEYLDIFEIPLIPLPR